MPAFRPLPLAAAVAAALLAACGGKSDPPAVTTTAVSGVVADGPLQGATVCYDLNDNAACDADEPSAVTDADGRYSFEAPTTALGLHGIVASVPATAVDKDTGAPVGAAFTLRAPPTGSAATTVFVSPLTTLVVDVAAARGLTPAEAASSVQGQLGLTNSPLANFVAGADTQAATLARTVNTVILEVTQLATAANVPADARAALVASVTSGDLSTLAALVAGSSASTPAAIAAEVANTVLDQRNLNEQTVAAQATAAQQVAAAAPATATTGPFVSVRRFTWTDSANHQLQAFVGDSTPGANGRYLVSETRVNRNAGNALPFNRNTAYWVADAAAAGGGQWVVCDNAWQIIDVTPATATTPQLSTFCGASRSRSKVSEYSVAGQRMADVIASVRAWPLRDTPGFDTDATGLPTRWGPAPSALGDATFPDNATFTIRETVQEVGDTERYTLTDKPRVAPPGGVGVFRHAATFTDLKRMTGNVVDAAVTVGNANTVFIDDLPFDQTDANLLDVKRYRAAFDPAGNAVRFYACDVLASTLAAQNCQVAGDGTSAIAEQGDSRVLRFTAGYPPALVAALKRQRLFVERSGVVFGGARDLERVVFQQRPNTTAWNALRTALGMDEPPAPTAPAGPGPFRLLRNFTFADINNYNIRELVGDSSTANAQGQFLVDEVRRIRIAGVDTPFNRNALYWTGSTWFDCGNNGTGILTASTVAPFPSSYCGTFNDNRYNNATVTLTGRTMADVARDIRWYPTKDGTFDYSGWGPNPDTNPVLASTVFPAGSTMEYRGNVRTATPIVLFTAVGSRLRVAPADPSVPFDTWPFATSLDEVIAKYPGNLLGATVNGANALWVQGYSLPAPPAPEYTTQVEIRVAFDANGNKARFWRNYRAVATGFTAAYTVLLDTTYTVETLDGKRVLRFAALPDGFEADFGMQRLFAEHNGFVSYAEKQPVTGGPSYQVRLNATASAALTQALGIPAAP